MIQDSSVVVRSASLVILLSAIGLAADGPSNNQEGIQEMVTLPVRVVSESGEPVAGAKVIPWALRCSQGHGSWQTDGLGASEPPTLTTDVQGRCDVPYPRFAKVAERIRTLEITLSIDHPDFAYIDYEFIDVPREDQKPHEVTVEQGCVVELVPVENGHPTSPERLYAMWSDGRSWIPEVSPQRTEDGALRFPPMPAGDAQVLIMRMAGQRATHFSRVVRLELERGRTIRQDVELLPATRIEGALSENVPRPVTGGRVKARILRSEPKEQIDWFTWVPIAADGSFAIDGWPQGEAVQLIALCDGFIGKSGEPPAVVENVRDSDPCRRPQVFLPEVLASPITIEMTPRVRCEIQTVNRQGTPIADARVSGSPIVGWWNLGSQIYCAPLVRGEKLLIVRAFSDAIDESPFPYETITDADGKGSIELPTGDERLNAQHDDYELPIIRGKRSREVSIAAGDPIQIQLVMQQKGTELLGDWDKLTGTLFGCTGEQCLVLMKNPVFREKMSKVRAAYDEVSDPTNPEFLSKAYTTIAEAFTEVGDHHEAAKWHRKAAEQSGESAAELAGD